MAISLLEQNQNEDENNRQINGLPTLGGDRSSNFSTGMNPQGAAPKGSSGRFTNLKKYIDANQQGANTTAERMGRSVDNDFNNYQNQFSGKLGEVNKGISDATSLFDTGDTYKQNLNSINNDLNTFQSMDNRDTFNKGGQNLFDFNRDNGDKFNQLRQGLGLNQEQLQQSQGLNQAMNDQYLNQAQQNAQGIQTEQGRYNILRQAQPKFGGYSSGQERLDQLLFQATPSAVNSLQNTFNTNLDKIKSNQDLLSGSNSSLQAAIAREAALQGDLQNTANTVQDTFVNKLNQKSNFDQINQARQALFNDYQSQLQGNDVFGTTGNKQYNISKDLADMLGLSDLGGYGVKGSYTYTPQEVPTGAGTANPDVISKIGQLNPSPVTVDISPNANQFTMFNTGKDFGSYIKQGKNAETFQDLLTQPDYGVYQALANLSGRDKGLAYGASNIGRAVSANGNLGQDIQLANSQFNQKYTNPDGSLKKYQVIGTGVGAGGVPNAGENAGAILNNQGKSQILEGNDNAGKYWDSLYNGAQDLTGGVGLSYATNVGNVDLAKLIGGGTGLGDVQNLYKDQAGTTATTMRGAQNDASANMQAQLQQLIDQIKATGAKNMGTLTDQNTADKYSRFGGLV